MKSLNINIENFFDLSAFVFLKDKRGIFHSSNDYMAKHAGLEKGSDLIGATDYDLCWKSEALSFQLADQRVINQKQSLLLIENVTSADQTLFRTVSYKIPLYTHSRKTMLFGIALLMNKEQSIPELLNGVKIPFKAMSDVIINKTLANTDVTNRFPKRQAECLYYLVKGMTAAQVASKMGLSKRTVESYIAILKSKLNCTSKSELIKKAWNFAFIKEKLLADE